MKNTIISNFGLDKLGLSQSDVDFLDVKLEEDNLIFVDYNKILKFKTPLNRDMKASLDAFLNGFFQSAFFKRKTESRLLLKGLHECNATRLGYSSNKPHGNSVGSVLQQLILENTEFVVDSLKSGQFSYNTLYFGVDQVGPDRISDILVSIIKPQLILYTQEQCVKHNIPTTMVKVKSIFNPNKLIWETGKYELPVHDGLPIIFIPKSITSTDGGLISSYNKFLRYGFRHFVKHNTEYQFLVDENEQGKGVKKKDYEAYLKDKGIPYKDEVKKWILGDAMSILNFESELMDDLEEISTAEILKTINP
ncbi:hypothetical protein [Pedobacter helvus]|uniref:Uncharacterized protein n=1 Tax=Pedobacter helvus TaxID=2563444 RepID=A0ABW9JKB6_9SPHI|nr:hypothetical protein [Pedobacter ureilyticus]